MSNHRKEQSNKVIQTKSLAIEFVRDVHSELVLVLCASVHRRQESLGNFLRDGHHNRLLLLQLRQRADGSNLWMGEWCRAFQRTEQGEDIVTQCRPVDIRQRDHVRQHVAGLEDE